MLVFKLVIQGCSDMKSIALLTTALFLASAPSPDSQVISEFTAGFMVSDNTPTLMAAELDQPALEAIVVVKPEKLAEQQLMLAGKSLLTE